jgi:hypothetical protein
MTYNFIPLQMDPPPEFIKQREEIWSRLKKEYDDFVANQKPVPIKVTLPDGKVVEGESWRTTPYEVAKGISQGLADNTVVAKVNGEVWDLDRPFEGDAELKLLKFDDPDGKASQLSLILTLLDTFFDRSICVLAFYRSHPWRGYGETLRRSSLLWASN